MTDSVDAVMYKFTNKVDSPYLDSLLAMFYEGAYQNTLGIMEAFDLTENAEVPILVGVAVDENGKPECFPIAKLLRAEDVPNFLSPDGVGGFYDPLDPVAADIAKENMKPLKEAVEADGTD